MARLQHSDTKLVVGSIIVAYRIVAELSSCKSHGKKLGKLLVIDATKPGVFASCTFRIILVWEEFGLRGGHADLF